MDYQDALSETLDLLHEIASDYQPAVLANAFGPESMIMTDLIVKHDLGIRIISIDTGRHRRSSIQRVWRRRGPAPVTAELEVARGQVPSAPAEPSAGPRWRWDPHSPSVR